MMHDYQTQYSTRLVVVHLFGALLQTQKEFNTTDRYVARYHRIVKAIDKGRRYVISVTMFNGTLNCQYMRTGQLH